MRSASAKPGSCARKRYVAGTPIIVVTRCSAMSRRARAGVERRLQHDRRALPPGEQRLDVPAADVELRQHAEHDVVLADAGRPGRRRGSSRSSSRASAARPSAGRSCPRCRRGGADRRPRRRSSTSPSRLERRVADPRDLDRDRGRARQLLVLRRGEEERRLGVLELVGDLRRREAPARPAAGTTPSLAQAKNVATWSGDVPVRVASRSPRRSPRAARPAASRLARRSSSPYVSSPPRKRIAARSGVARARSASQRPMVSSRLIDGRSSRKRVTEATNASGSSQKKRCPRPSKRSRRASGTRSARRSALRGSTTPSSVPVRTSVARGDLAHAVVAVEPDARRRLRRPGGLLLRGREPVLHDPVDELRPLRGRRGRERVLDEPPQRDRRLERRRLGHQRERSLRQRKRLRPAGRRAREHEPVDAARVRERELLRHHAAEARPDDVRPLDPRLVQHRDGVRGQLGDGVRPRRRVALPDAAVVEEEHVEPLGEPRQHRLPAPARVAEPVDEQQRLARAAPLPGDPGRSRGRLLGQRLRFARSPRSRVGRLASPPGTKKTSATKSAPSRKSGSESGTRSTSGRSCTSLDPASEPSRWSSSV